MSELKHTPGPWAWETNFLGVFTLMSVHPDEWSGCGTAILDGMRWTLDWHDGEEPDWERIPEEEDTANAALIAAAPETAAERDELRAERDALLAAAENMIGYFEEQPHGTIDRLSQCAFMFRAAIARARKTS